MMFTLGGNAIHITGTALTTIGFLYFINKVSTNAINIIEYIPSILSSQKNNDDDDRRIPSFKFKDFYRVFQSYTKISVLIVVGVLLKSASTIMLSDEWVGGIENLMYSDNMQE
eukprot:TRINITY_DN1823_c0_g2_i1.p1 TRINITY_DN1823_c0_g2~~TRINITY_DN1823_c0_g2_i1.p1  ORF type:complete len:113 (+),score=19.51 TRINITY_DN1823_c0_g2_i1:67-405(+)